jgi:hypothetical protein
MRISEITEAIESEDLAFVKIVRQILPSGFGVYGSEASWSKRGGHAGANSIDRAIDKAMKLGFVKKDHQVTGTPDGSHMGGGTTFVHPEGLVMSTSRSYGATAYDNRFSIAIKRVQADDSAT